MNNKNNFHTNWVKCFRIKDPFSLHYRLQFPTQHITIVLSSNYEPQLQINGFMTSQFYSVVKQTKKINDASLG